QWCLYQIRSRQVGQRPLPAEVRIAELVDAVAEAVRQRQQQPVVRQLFVRQCPAHLEVEAVADQHERDVVVGVRVALPQFVGPQEQRVVQQAPLAARLRRLGETLRQVRQLLAEPRVDL